MSNLIGEFIQHKKDESPFLTLKDKESVVIKRLKDINLIVKAGFGGEEKQFLRLKCEVETSEGIREKIFDNPTQRFAQELEHTGVVIGCGFILSRTGEGAKTRYTVSDVINP